MKVHALVVALLCLAGCATTVGTSRVAGCYDVDSVPIGPAEIPGRRTVYNDIPTYLSFSTTHNPTFVPEHRAMSLSGVSKYSELFGHNPNWEIKDGAVHADYGDGLNGIFFILARSRKGLAGTAKSYGDIADPNIYFREAKVVARSVSCRR